MDAGVATGATRFGLLHTVPSLAATFADLLAERAPGMPATHVVDPALLATAIARGVTPDVTRTVAAHVDHLVAVGATAALVCARRSARRRRRRPSAVGRSVPVLRVDAAMAAEAAGSATAPGARGRIAVLATLATHDRLVGEAVRRLAGSADVVVLAQASMAPAAAGARVHVPVLSSPASGAATLVTAPRTGRARRVRPAPRARRTAADADHRRGRTSVAAAAGRVRTVSRRTVENP